MIDQFSPVDRSRMAVTFTPPSMSRGMPAVNDATLEQFLAACGSSEPLRLGVGERDELMSETRLFRQPFVVIGRRPECDLVLDHWQVSRRHAYIQLIEGRYYCIDLGSRTGTHGGDSAERSGWLERGRAIQIGPYAVRPEVPSSAARPSGPGPAVTWELPGRAIGQAVWRMDRHLALVGRAPACKIRIVEPDVSKFHCSLVLTPHGVWAVDLLGQKGLLVNDQPARCARVDDGDELRIGRHILRARYDSPPLPLPPAGREGRPPAPRAEARPALPMSLSLSTPGAASGPTELAIPSMSRELPTVFATGGGAIDPSVNVLVHQFGMMQQQMFDQFHQTMMMMFEGFAALHREQSGSLREEFDEVRKLSEEIEALRRETARLADGAAKARRPGPANGHGPSAGPPPRAQVPPPRPQGPPPQKVSMPEPDPEVDIHAQLLLRLSTIQTERQNRWQRILGMMSSKS